MTEREFEGSLIAQALANQGTMERVLKALIGCQWYLEDPDILYDIVSTADDGSEFTIRRLAEEKVVRRGKLVRGFILEEREQSLLEPLIDESTPEHVREQERARAELVRRGIRSKNITGDHAAEMIGRIRKIEGGMGDCWEDQRRIAHLLEIYGQDRDYIRLVIEWRQSGVIDRGYPDFCVNIQMARAYRQIHDLEKSLQETDVLLKPDLRKRMLPKEGSILWTQRAAIFLDLYESGRLESGLEEARQCANRSYAIWPSVECGNVYNRIRRLEELRRGA